MAGPLGSTPGIIVGVGVGSAAAVALEPAIEIPRQEAWARNANRLLDAGLLARLVAQGGIELGTAHDEAKRDGFEKDKLDALVYLAQTVPGFASALALWRRNPQDFADLWTHALVKSGLDARYLPWLNTLKDDRLSPPVVALAIVRGIIEDPGFLPVGPPTKEGNVKAFPTSTLDALEEARAFGFNRDRLFVQTAISGRPMGPESAAAAVFKKILERVDFDRAIAEGDVRNEWADAIFENARPIPHPLDYIEGRLRGWIDDDGMHLGAHRSGMRDADTDFLLKIHGRPLSFHQVFIGERRGGTYDGPTAGIDPHFLKSLQESNIRPEWYNLAWAQRHSYPSAFVLRALTESGDLTQVESRDILLFIGWPQALADKVSTRWAGSVGSASKQLVKSELISEFEGGFLSPSELRDHLTALGYSGPELELEVHLADARRIKAWRDKGITAVNKSFLGSAMTVDQAKVYLQDLGVTDPDTLTRITDIWVLERGLP